MTEYAYGTRFFYSPFPFRQIIAARVLCADGKVRKTSRWNEYGDRCTVKVRGKRVKGFVYAQCRSGLSTPAPDDPTYLYFHAYQDDPNAHLLSEGYRECMCEIGRAMMHDHYELWKTLPLWMIG